MIKSKEESTYSVDRYGEPTVTTGIVWSEPFLGHKEWYNGTCQFLHLAAAGSTTGIGAGRELMTPLIIDAYDGLWTMFIVMTTVGYNEFTEDVLVILPDITSNKSNKNHNQIQVQSIYNKFRHTQSLL